MPTRKKRPCVTVDLLDDAAAATHELPQVTAELEAVAGAYERVVVSGKPGGQRKVVIALAAEHDGDAARGGVQLEVTLVPGYPYLPPRVRLHLAPGVQLGDAGALTADDVAELRRDVCEGIQPCLAAGVPCIMQMVALVSSVLERRSSSGSGEAAVLRSTATHACASATTTAACDTKNGGGDGSGSATGAASRGVRTTRHGDGDAATCAREARQRSTATTTATTTAAGATSIAAAAAAGVVSASVATLPAPTLTPVPLKAQDAMKLTLLTLHVLRKCCHMKDMESREEAESNFTWLASYLLREVSVFPRAALALALPWRGGVFARAFAKDVRAALAQCERADLLKWFWEDEERTLRLQQGSEGRYRSEFIEQRLLGSGGFAPVYVCRKKIDGRLYAIKKIVMNVTQTDRVLREVQTLAALHHKNIVRYYDAWVEDGCEAELRKYMDDDDDDDDDDDASSSSSSDEDDDNESSSSSSSGAGSASDSDDDTSSDDDDSTSSSSDDSTTGHDEDDVTTTTAAGVASRQQRRYQTLYIQMELCSARSLRHVLDDSDRDGSAGLFASSRGEKAALSILRQLLTVVAHTHREQIVHRDLKPENVLFEMRHDGGDDARGSAGRHRHARDGGGGASSTMTLSSVGGGGDANEDDDVGTIRVVDFGLARVMSDVRRVSSTANLDLIDGNAAAAVTAMAGDAALSLLQQQQQQQQPTGNCGSVLYSAPEQANGLDYDVRVDEFSIGMIALEMWLAVAGKDFRERYAIMTEVWRGGALPEWFVRWNATMAHVIASLLERDARRRRTCEDILASATLPGDPPELADALDTVERYGDRLASRVLQRLRRVCAPYRKPPPALCAAAQLCASNACTSLCHAIHVVAMLHGCAPVSTYDALVPMNDGLAQLGVDSVLDMAGRCFAYAALPHYAIASFLGVLTAHDGGGGGGGGGSSGGGGGGSAGVGASLGAFYQFYCKQRPYVVFTSPLRRADEVNESALEPLLCVLHLLSLMQFSDTTAIVELAFSHVDWLRAVVVASYGDNNNNDDDCGGGGNSMTAAARQHPTRDVCALCTRIEQPEQLAPALSRIGDALAVHAGVAPSHERHTLLHSYVTLALHAIACFDKPLASRARVCVDPALLPSSTLVDGAALDVGGVLVECRLRHDHNDDDVSKSNNSNGGGDKKSGKSKSGSNGNGNSGSSTDGKTMPLAFGCMLDNFVAKCTVAHRRASAFSVVLDMQLCAYVCRHVRLPVAEPLLLNGVAVRRQDLYAQTHMNDVVAAAVRLWQGNIRACVRCDSDLHSLAEVLKAKQLRWLLLDGHALTAVSTGLQSKAAMATSTYGGSASGSGGGGGGAGGCGVGGTVGSGKQTLLSLHSLCSDVRQLGETTRQAERRALEAKAQAVFVANAVATAAAGANSNTNSNNGNGSHGASARRDGAVAQHVESLYANMLQAPPPAVVLVVDATMQQVAQCISELSSDNNNNNNNNNNNSNNTTAVAALAQWLRSNAKATASVLPVYSTIDNSLACFMPMRQSAQVGKRAKDKNTRKHR